MPTYWVTPRLYVGDPPPHLSETIEVTSVKEAVGNIEAGRIAVLPPGRFDLASQVLAHFGLSEDERADAIHFARTGRLR